MYNLPYGCGLLRKAELYENKYTKRSSNTLLHLVYLFSEWTVLGLLFGAWKLVFNHRLMQRKKHSISEALYFTQFLSLSLIILVRNIKISSHQFLKAQLKIQTLNGLKLL